MRVRTLGAALGTVLALSAAAPASANAAEPMEDGGAILRHAAITFITTTENKDHDSRVTLTLRDSLGRVAGRLSGTFDEFKDDSENGPYELVQKADSTYDEIKHGDLTIRLDPTGDDTWRFNFYMDISFTDGRRLVSTADTLELSDDHRQQTFGIA